MVDSEMRNEPKGKGEIECRDKQYSGKEQKLWEGGTESLLPPF